MNVGTLKTLSYLSSLGLLGGIGYVGYDYWENGRNQQFYDQERTIEVLNGVKSPPPPKRLGLDYGNDVKQTSGCTGPSCSYHGVIGHPHAECLTDGEFWPIVNQQNTVALTRPHALPCTLPNLHLGCLSRPPCPPHFGRALLTASKTF